jgi:hypothetical protein
LRVAGDIPGAAVQQAVISSGRPGIEILFLYQDTFDSAQRKIPGKSSACHPAAYNQNLGPQIHNLFKPVPLKKPEQVVDLRLLVCKR